MERSLSYLERSMRDRQHELLAEAQRIAAARAARSGYYLAATRSSARDRALLNAVARPGAAITLQPRPAADIAAECAAKVAAWRRAAASFGRSLVTVGRRLEQVGRAA